MNNLSNLKLIKCYNYIVDQKLKLELLHTKFVTYAITTAAFEFFSVGLAYRVWFDFMFLLCLLCH